MYVLGFLKTPSVHAESSSANTENYLRPTTYLVFNTARVQHNM